MSKYSERLKRTSQQISDDSVSSAEKTAVFSIKKAILAADEQISILEAAEDAALGKNPFNLNTVLSLAQEKAEQVAIKVVAERLLAEEFSA